MKVRRSAALAVAAVLLALAACETSSPTSPSRAAVRPSSKPLADIQGDTLSCRNGWQVVEGWYVCN